MVHGRSRGGLRVLGGLGRGHREVRVLSDVTVIPLAAIIPQFSCFTITELVNKRGARNRMGWGGRGHRRSWGGRRSVRGSGVVLRSQLQPSFPRHLHLPLCIRSTQRKSGINLGHREVREGSRDHASLSGRPRDTPTPPPSFLIFIYIFTIA